MWLCSVLMFGFWFWDGFSFRWLVCLVSELVLGWVVSEKQIFVLKNKGP